MDPEEYRRQYEREIAGAGKGKQATPAGAAMGTRELVTAIKDTGRPPAERIQLIQGASVGAVDKPSLMQALINMLADPHEDPAVRLASLKTLQQSTFSGTRFRRYDADYRQALRAASTDDNAQVREAAIEQLALTGDEYAQRLLVQGLQDPGSALVPPQKALQMLGSDVHAEHYPLLRDLVATSKKPAVRRSALRLLAADSDATDLFAHIAADKSEDAATRATSAIALQSLAPEQFQDLARDVVLDDDDSTKVRATFVNALAHGADTPRPAVDEKVRSLADPNAQPGVLRTAARQYVRQRDAGS